MANINKDSIDYWQKKAESLKEIIIFFSVIFSLIIASFLFGTFNTSEIIVSTDSGDVKYVDKKWWGFSQKEYVIQWMKTDGYDGYGWMTKDEKGEWYLFIIDAPDPIDE